MKESGEDYLETIFLLSKNNPGVHAIDIAKKLGYSKPSVTRAIGILKSKGFVIVDEFNHIKLTNDGLVKAEKLYERHRTLSKFLELLGVKPQIAEKDACRMEHDISDETFCCISKFVEANNH